MPLQQRARPDARELQKLRRVDGAARQDHLAPRRRRPARAMLNVVDTRGPPPLEPQARHLRMHLHLQVFPPHRRAQEGARRRHAAAALGGELIEADALLFRAVEIGSEGEARRFARGNEVAAQRMRVVANVGDVQRPAPSAIGGIARGIILDRLVGGQHLVEAPARIAGALPVVVVLGMAADIDHGIDRGGAAQDLAARIIVALPVEAGIGLGLVHPVDAAGRRRSCHSPAASARRSGGRCRPPPAPARCGARPP